MSFFEKSLNTLELPAVLEMLASQAVGEAAKERALALTPSVDRFTDENGKEFDYWIADLYEPWKDVPEGCETRVIPGGLWAQFTCRGPLVESMQSVNTQIWSEWLPNLKGYTLAGNYSLEFYMPPAEKPEDNVNYIWIPLKKD